MEHCLHVRLEVLGVDFAQVEFLDKEIEGLFVHECRELRAESHVLETKLQHGEEDDNSLLFQPGNSEREWQIVEILGAKGVSQSRCDLDGCCTTAVCTVSETAAMGEKPIRQSQLSIHVPEYASLHWPMSSRRGI